MYLQAARERLISKGVSNPSRLAVELSITAGERRRFLRRYVMDTEEELAKKIETVFKEYESKVDSTGTPYFMDKGKVMWEI